MCWSARFVVTILDAEGKVSEQGDAVLIKGLWWEYLTVTAGKVIVEAWIWQEIWQARKQKNNERIRRALNQQIYSFTRKAITGVPLNYKKNILVGVSGNTKDQSHISIIIKLDGIISINIGGTEPNGKWVHLLVSADRSHIPPSGDTRHRHLPPQHIHYSMSCGLHPLASDCEPTPQHQ